MKDLSKLLLAGLFTIGFSACNDDGIGSENGPNDGPDAVYMQFKLGLPGTEGTRSETNSDNNDPYGTSNGGVEIGQTNENTVSTILVVLTKTDNTYITHSTSNFSSTDDKQTYVIPFSSTALNENKGEDIKVNVYCNPSNEFVTSVGTTHSVNAKYTDQQDAKISDIWEPAHFLMTNADDDINRTLPESFEKHKVESNPVKLGTIYVERAAARFDYKQGGIENKSLYTLTEIGADKKAGVQIQLTDMALVNMSKDFWYLRRVSDNGKTDGANFTIGGTEYDYESTDGTKKANYVVDTDAKWKASFNSTTTDAAEHFKFSITNNNYLDNLKWQSISELENDSIPEDNDNKWNNSSATNRQGYKIWRYATENTIPCDEENTYEDKLQVHGITTGVVFKGYITFGEGLTEDSGLGETLTKATETIYAFGNMLIGTWENVKKAADEKLSDNLTPANPALKIAYEQVEAEYKKDGTKDKDKIAAEKLFTVYKPTTGDNENPGKYEVLYYYWNRHNDNGNNGIMGPMEFAVVRNNVYKLSVTSIERLGHPLNGEDPEDPDNPTDPDENDNVYFEVAVQVLPWVVRINDIIL